MLAFYFSTALIIQINCVLKTLPASLATEIIEAFGLERQTAGPRAPHEQSGFRVQALEHLDLGNRV